MSIASIVRGHGTGARLFLVWTLGTFVAYGIGHAFTFGTPKGTSTAYRLGWILCLLILSFWYAVLLLPTWLSRVGWTYMLFFGLVAGSGMIETAVPPWYLSLWIAALLHTFFLIRVRQRVWLWLLALFGTALVAWLSHRTMHSVYLQAYAYLGQFVDQRFFLRYENACGMLHYIAFGAAAAFMPPIVAPPIESKAIVADEKHG